MAMVKFATTCDVCGDRSEEYTQWPSCRECGLHICPQHYKAETVKGPDVDTPVTCVCHSCAAEE